MTTVLHILLSLHLFSYFNLRSSWYICKLHCWCWTCPLAAVIWRRFGGNWFLHL